MYEATPRTEADASGVEVGDWSRKSATVRDAEWASGVIVGAGRKLKDILSIHWISSAMEQPCFTIYQSVTILCSDLSRTPLSKQEHRAWTKMSLV